MKDADLVFQAGNRWFFYDETFDPVGPYLTREEAKTMLDKYCREVLGIDDEDPRCVGDRGI